MDSTEGASKYCPECGAEIREVAEICPDCGADQTSAESIADNREASGVSFGIVVAAVGLVSGLFSMLFAPLVFAAVTVICGIIALLVYDRRFIGSLTALWGVAAPVIAFLIRDYISGALT